MMRIKIKDIKIDRSNRDTQRIRKDFGDIEELAESIKKHGLIHPIVVDKIKPLGFQHPNAEVREHANVVRQYKYTLVAGERRLTAHLYAGMMEIEATIRSELSAFERKEIELEENARRKDLSWDERNEALRQLHELKQTIHGARQPGDVGEGGWTMQDTAKLVRLSLGTVSQDIKLANDLKNNPKLRKQVSGMTKQVARKTIEREKDARRMRKRISNGEISIDSRLVLGKAEEEILKLEDQSIDCLITDPPFAVEAILNVERGSLSGKYAGEANVGEVDVMDDVYEKLLPQLSRVMKPGAHFYMFFGIDWYEFLMMMFRRNGFIAHPVPLIWPKGRGTMIPNPYHYIPSYEFILFGMREPMKRTLAHPIRNCLEGFPPDASQKRIHSLQKPFELIKMMIENSTVPGETILDCFAGSGIVLKVAEALGRRGVGFEMNEVNYYKAQEFLIEGEK